MVEIDSSNRIPIKIPAGLSVESDKLVLKFTWRYKEPQIAEITLEMKDAVGGRTLPDSKMCFKAMVNERA